MGKWLGLPCCIIRILEECTIFIPNIDVMKNIWWIYFQILPAYIINGRPLRKPNTTVMSFIFFHYFVHNWTIQLSSVRNTHMYQCTQITEWRQWIQRQINHDSRTWFNLSVIHLSNSLLVSFLSKIRDLTEICVHVYVERKEAICQAVPLRLQQLLRLP